jgi:hypothetical protein
MSEEELPNFELDDSYSIPPTGEPHNLDDTVDYSDDEESFQEGETTLADETRDEDSDWSFGTQENPGPMTLAELQGGAGKKKRRRQLLRRKQLKRKQPKRKQPKRKQPKRKQPKRKQLKRKQPKRKQLLKRSQQKENSY